MSKLFERLWVRSDTHIPHLTGWQGPQVYRLCEKFFEKGRKVERDKYRTKRETCPHCGCDTSTWSQEHKPTCPNFPL